MARSTLQSRINSLQKLIDHPKTGEAERDAARVRLAIMLKKAAEAGHPFDAPTRPDGYYGENYDGQYHPTSWYTARIRADIKVRRNLRKVKGEAGSVAIRDLITDAPESIAFSVRTPHHGSMIITIKGVPETWWVPERDGGYHNWVGDGDRLVPGPDLNELAAELAAIASSYRYDRSDAMTDYFDTNFYVSVHAEPVPDREYEFQINNYWCADYARRQREEMARRAEWEARYGADA